MNDIVVDKSAYLFFAAHYVASTWWEQMDYLKAAIDYCRVHDNKMLARRRLLYAQTRGIVLYDRAYQQAWDAYEQEGESNDSDN